MSRLAGKIALVTGATRGAGKGIAIELAKEGAFVYITGRSSRDVGAAGRPGTLEETLEAMQAVGGRGRALRCDHTDDGQTEAAVRILQEEQGRLDLLVNNVWGGNETEIVERPFWELSPGLWDSMFTSGVRAQLMTNYCAVPLMRRTPGGLIVHTTFWDEYRYTGNFYYDLAKNALVRMAFALSKELKPDGIAVIPLSPGWMRTELVLAAFGTDETGWHSVEALAGTESTAYIGRAVAALAADRRVMDRTGQPQQVGMLAEEYGFTDIDGRRIPPFLLPD